MRRLLARGSQLLIATHNAGKLAEIAALLAPWAITCVSAGQLGLPEPEETAESFAGNAALKARAAATAANLPALADDSGFSVAALRGAPGVHSARWAGEPRDFVAAMARVHREMDGNPDRRAWFTCVLCLAWPDGHEAHFEGRVDGTVVWPPRGTHGFGYDPMFVPNGDTRTYGEMPPAEKQRSSHRALAFARLRGALLR